MNAKNISVGDRVTLSRVVRPDFVGASGVVKKLIRWPRGGCGEVRIKCDDGRIYEAVTSNVTKCL
jgi:hypothetical protein